MKLRSNIKYLRIVLTHKWYVLRYGWGTVPFKRLLLHDLSKFGRAEWSGYRERFASGRAGLERKDEDGDAFLGAWRHHYLNNPHHWEFWIAENMTAYGSQGAYHAAPPYDAALNVYEMPETYVYEMVADWKAAGKVYSGGGEHELREWYERTKYSRVLHPTTLKLVEFLVGIKWRDVRGTAHYEWDGWAGNQQRKHLQPREVD